MSEDRALKIAKGSQKLLKFQQRLNNSKRPKKADDSPEKLQAETPETADLMEAQAQSADTINDFTAVETNGGSQNVFAQYFAPGAEDWLQKDAAPAAAEMEEADESAAKQLQEQLQLHAQTLSILVQEKEELQEALGQAQAGLRQRTLELEEAQSRLNAARHKSSTLERDLTALKMQCEAASSSKEENNHLRLAYSELLARFEELGQQAAETRAKHTARTQELSGLWKELETERSEVSKLQLRLQQLQELPSPPTAGQHQQEELTERLQAAEQALKTALADKDLAAGQYQQFVRHLNAQLLAREADYDAVVAERNAKERREAELVQHISSLEELLQQARAQPPISPPTPSPSPPSQQEQQEQQEQQHVDNAQLLGELSREIEGLKLQLDAKEERIRELELQRQEATPDMDKLIATMESDKIAAARAVGQNREMKLQIQELEESFITLSNTKLQLTEQLESAEYKNKELSERTHQAETALEKLKTVLEARDKEMLRIETESEALRKQMQQHHHDHHHGHHHDHHDHHHGDDDHHLEEPANYLETEQAMRRLEERFQKTMVNLAELTDEKQRLEHLVMQLQSETDTIGEYVALYQYQRSVLRQRTLERDEQLRKLARDREEIRVKLEHLGGYVGSLPPDQGPAKAKIVELVSEIKASSLVQPRAAGEDEGVHHCPWCSGELITV